MRIIKQKYYSGLIVRVFTGLLILSAMSLSGCHHYLVNYSTAQKQFNTASQFQMNQVFEPTLGVNAENAVMEFSQIQTNYALALNIITEIIEDNKSALTEDMLLGNAYTIKALSEWNLGETNKALATQKLAQNNLNQLFPRDNALMSALPGLIKADQAYAKLPTVKDGKAKTKLTDKIIMI